MISLMHPKRIWALAYILALPFLVSVIMALTQMYLPLGVSVILFCIVLCAWIVTRFNLHSVSLLVLAFLLPFSFEYPVSGNFTINIPSEPMLAVILISIVWESLKSPATLRQMLSGETLWILPLIAFYLIFTLFSDMTMVSVKFTSVVVTYIIVFYVWQKYQFRQHHGLLIRLAGVFSLAIFLIYIYSLLQFRGYEWNPVTTKGIFRPFFKDNTIFGASAAILAVFWLLMIRTAQLKSIKIAYLVIGLIFVSAVIVSNSRASFLSLLFSATIGLLFVFKVGLKTILTGIVLTLLMLFVFNMQVFKLLRENTYHFRDSGSGYVERIKSTADVNSNISNLERMNRWAAGVSMFTDKPFAGFGPGTYQFAYLPYQHQAFINKLSVKDLWHIPENSGGTAHSEYILALSEMGIFGFIAFIIVLGRWIWLAFRNSYKLNNSERVVIQVAFTAVSTYLFHAFFNNFLNTDKFAFLFWGLAAWMSAHYESNLKKPYGVLS